MNDKPELSWRLPLASVWYPLYEFQMLPLLKLGRVAIDDR